MDNNVSNCLIQGNIIARTSGYSINMHGGQHNFIEHNIFVDATSAAAVRSVAGKIEYTGFRGQIGFFGYQQSSFLTANRFCNNILYFRKTRYDKRNPIFYLRPRGDRMGSKGEVSDILSESRGNIFFRPDGEECVFTEITQVGIGEAVKDVEKVLSLGEWQKQGFDLDSVQADPLFLDPVGDDYRVKPESVAFRLGFRPTDVTKIGIRPTLRLAQE
jgi:hypothetical protein